MLLFFGIITLPAVAAFILSRRLGLAPEPWLRTALRMLALFAAGLFAAAPFLTTRGVGTGESYNYHLALADAVTQLRAGEIPPLVGQTEYAFNGRIHPLRNAPYLFYLAGALDAASLHHFAFWTLQNLTLALSLVAAVFSAYGSLRWSTGCPRLLAYLLAVIYGLCPALLNAGTVNLFMTVHVAPFLPLALGACLRQCRRWELGNDIVMAAALAAAWLAHPPVAFWLTAPVGLIRLLILWPHPTWQARWGLFASGVLGACLAGFVFVSTADLNTGLDVFRDNNLIHSDYVTAIMGNVQAAFPGTLLPVSPSANTLADFKLGYASWFLLAALLVSLVPLWWRNRPGMETTRLAALGVAAGLLVLNILCLPLSSLTTALWGALPTSVLTLTNVWPMQRLYLVTTGLAVFGAALVAPLWTGPAARRVLLAGAMLGAGWTLWEAEPFRARNVASRWSQGDTDRAQLVENVDLTITSYSFLGVPETYVNGVMDPRLEFRLLQNDREIASRRTVDTAASPPIARGELLRPAAGTEPVVPGSTRLRLEPGRRYLLTFDFSDPLEANLDITGPTVFRNYVLPGAGQSKGFGTGPDHYRSISLRTAGSEPEMVDVRLAVHRWLPAHGPGARLATYALQELDQSRLPVQVASLFPLRLTIEAPAAGCSVVTPRSYLPGYEIFVNGAKVQAFRSTDGMLMFPVPPGTSDVQVNFPGSRRLRVAFWLGVASWLGLVSWYGTRFFRLEVGAAVVRHGRWVLAPLRWLRRHRLPLAAALALVVIAAVAWRTRAAYLDSFGPVELRVIFPRGQNGENQPLLVTGSTGAGANVFVSYVDDQHVRLGADIWGSLYQSEVIAVDYHQVQIVVVNASGLYPLDHPRARAFSPNTLAGLRQDFRVELNGHLAISVSRLAYESTVSQVTVGANRIGSSLTKPRFKGRILSAQRLPVPETFVLARDQGLSLDLRLPSDRAGETETLLAFGDHGQDGSLALTYVGKKSLRLVQRDAAGNVVASAQADYAPGAESHRMEFSFQAPFGSKAPAAVTARLDGRPFLGNETAVAASRPLKLLVGGTQNYQPDVQPRFSGRILRVASVAPPDRPAAPAFGPIRLTLTLPLGKTGRAEPLVTTGRTGKGDFAFMVYVDERHVRFGFDHWGSPGALSEPVEIDYTTMQEIEVSLSSLYPPEGDSAWKGFPEAERNRRLATMELSHNGRTVLTFAQAAHPSTQAEIMTGRNLIGGSSSEKEFTGDLHLAERIGLVP
jgi:hypothetical protein